LTLEWGYGVVLGQSGEGVTNAGIHPKDLLPPIVNVAAFRSRCATAQAKTHVIKTGPETVQWGYFDGSRSPIIHIDSGDIVEVETPLDSAKALESMVFGSSLLINR
jgi:hypothetical protein